MAAPTRDFAGSPIATVDTVNGTTNSLAGLNAANGLRAGVKVYNRGTDGVSADSYFTLKVSAAVVDHINVEAALGFSTHQWIKDTTPGGTGTVTSVASADGSVAITNPSTTPDLSVRIPTAATPVALAAQATTGVYQTGQSAFVLSSGIIYTLQATTGVTPDGLVILATGDDAARQWVASQRNLFGNMGAIPVGYMTANLDFTAGQTVTLVPALGAGFYFLNIATRFAFISQTGVCTTGPTVKGGNNGTTDNIIQSLANFPSFTNLNNAVNAPPGLNLTFSAATGQAVNLGTAISFVISVGAVGTGGYTLRARACIFGWLIPVGDLT